MKKFLSILLSLIFFICAFVSCNDEVPTGTSSEGVQGSESDEQSTKEESASNVVTRDTFANAYESWIGWYYETGISEDNCNMFSCVKAIFSYEEFKKGAIDFRPTGITEQTFEENFVIIVRGCEGHIRDYDIYYTDFEKQDGYYSLTYNIASYIDTEVSDAVQAFCDVCIIPKELCDDTNPQITKIIEKKYAFSGEEYNSPCEVFTTIHDVIGD